MYRLIAILLRKLGKKFKLITFCEAAKLNTIGRRTYYDTGLGDLREVDHIQDSRLLNYKGKVYGITLPEHHTLFVMRDDKHTWSGNSNLAASKGIIGKIIPNEQMPRNPVTNQPFDVIFNPMSIPSRVAPNQNVEIQLSKIAAKRGEPYRLPQEAPKEGWVQFAKNELKKHGVSPTSDVFDPETGKIMKNVTTGKMYLSAFHHLAEKKLTGRSTGGYDSNEQPIKGGGDTAQAQKFGNLDLTAVLSHNASDVIKDAYNIRGSKNQDYWKALKYGRPIPEPSRPFIYDKFFNLLKASGINLSQKGSIMGLLPMTNSDIDKLAGNRFISNGRNVDNKFNIIQGGLFDRQMTGGSNGTKWASIKLHEPLPNPIMEIPIQKILGLTNKEYRDVVTGKTDLNGTSGGKAIYNALNSIDIDKEIAKHKAIVKSSRGSVRDRSVKVLGYLSSARATGVHPRDWVINKVPVLPPVFRPIIRAGNMSMVNDMNTLYSDLIEMNNHVNDLSQEMPKSELQEERAKVYDGISAVFGLGQPINPEGVAKNLKGGIKIITGDIPKFGLFQNKVLSKPVDGVGRAVIAPDPTLDMDSVGIPEDKAWKLYKPYVTRRLVRRGFTSERALKSIEDREPVAEDMLRKEMEYRPVFLDRAPTWHKFNFMAFKAHPIKGDVLRISPIITSGFNADFDGDTMAYHVPSSDKAIAQAKKKMMPSQSLFKITTMRDLMPTTGKEFALGLYEATSRKSKKPPVVFKSAADAKKAYNEGKVDITDEIIIG